jgi:hypothetical protein
MITQDEDVTEGEGLGLCSLIILDTDVTEDVSGAILVEKEDEV